MDFRSKIVTGNMLVSAVMKIFSLLCSLVMVPLTIEYLNPERYGIWMTISSILYWFIFMDIGLGNGMRNYMAQALAKGDYENARKYFSTAMVILSGIALLIGLVALPLVNMLDLSHIFSTTTVGNRELAAVMSVAVVLSLIQFVAKNVGMVYIALQRYAINDLLSFIANILGVAIIYTLTRTTEGNLGYVVTVVTGLPPVVFLLAMIPLMKSYPQLKPELNSVDMSVAKEIVGKGLGFFAIQITSCLVVFGGANVIISHYCGPEQVTVYNVSYKLFSLLMVAYTIFLSPLWNAYTDAYVKNDYDWIKKTFRRSLLVWGLSVLGGMVLLLISPVFFQLWVGESVTIPMEVSMCVLAYVSAYNLNNCATFLINGINKIRIQIITSVVMTIIFVITILLVKGQGGIIGISLTMTITYLIMAAIHLYQCRQLIHRQAHGWWNK